MNRAELLKSQKNGRDVIYNLRRYVRLGLDAIGDDDLERLKWHGIFYRKSTPGYFMMRIRVPGGIITSEQLRVVGEIANTYGRGVGQITTRQQIQLRWFRLEDLPAIMERLHASGLSTAQTGHDNVRGLVGCPVSGLTADEVFDTEPIIAEVGRRLFETRAFTNLPRKFNISITGCRSDCGHSHSNDLAFTPAFSPYDPERPGFNVSVGGALGSQEPRLAQPLDAWVSIDEVPELCAAVLEVFRDHGLRAKRNNSRLKFLLAEWGVDRFREEVEAVYGMRLAPAGASALDYERPHDHIGVHAQQQSQYSYVGCLAEMGRFSGDQMREAARLAEFYGVGELRFTCDQNLIFPWIPGERVAALLAEPLLQQLTPEPAPALRGSVSCTGAEFCHFALIETKDRALRMARAIDAAFRLSEPLRINWSGCPNSCANHQTADIGLEGTKARIDGQTVEAVNIYLGGRLGPNASVGELKMRSVPCSELQQVLIALVRERLEDARLARQEAASPTGAPAAVSADDAAAPSPSPVAVLEAPATGVTAEGKGAAVRCRGSSGREFVVPLAPGANVLEAALDAGIDAEYDCMSGNCGTCMVRVLAGAEHLDAPTSEEELLLGSDLPKGFRLACQACARS